MTRPRSCRPDWDRRILLVVENIRDFSFLVGEERYGFFSAKRFKDPVIRHFLIRAGAMEPIGRLGDLPEGDLKDGIERSKIGAYHRGNRFFYRLDPELIDKLCTWASHNAPEMVARPDPLDDKKLLLVPRDKAFHNEAYFPWYVGW